MEGCHILFLVVCVGLLQESESHEGNFRDTGMTPSTEYQYSCSEYSLRIPYQCKSGGSSETRCDYTVKRKDSGRSINVTLSARMASKEGWSAVGFAASRTMAPHPFFVLCTFNGINMSSVQLAQTVNHSIMPLQSSAGLAPIQVHINQQDEVLTCSFSVSKELRLFGDPLDSRKWFLVLASGTYASNGSFASHINYSECACNLTSCMDCCQLNSSLRRLLMKLHGVVMIIVFMVLAPVAAIVARYYKPILPDSWFRVHMGVMVVSVLGILVGFGLILGHTAGTFTTGVHQYVGLVCIGLALLQPVYGFVRPPLGNTPRRKIFNVVHRIGAASILTLGTLNLFTGVYKLHIATVGLLVGTLVLHLVISLVTAVLLEFMLRPVHAERHVGYHKVKKLGNENSSSDEEVFVKKDSLKITTQSDDLIDGTNTCAKELAVLVTFLFLSFSLAGLASGMVYLN